MRAPILIVAVSARMLAELATGAGYRVIALDRFGDVDLRSVCASRSLTDLGGRGGMAALVGAADDIAADGVVYGGGLENRPDLVARLAGKHRLLGNGPEVLRGARDPEILGRALRSVGLAFPRTLPSAAAATAEVSRTWLRKPLRSGGGRGVREWRGGVLSGDEVVQERVPGVPCSVVAVADGRCAVVLGITEQLIGEPTFGGRGHAWCGNVVPPRIASDERSLLLRDARATCDRLAYVFGLVGLFGVDLVWDGRRAWIIEVNPRPPGSLEVVCGPDAFTAHIRAFEGELPRMEPGALRRSGAAAKAILYARADTIVGDTRKWHSQGIRDIPHPGERIAAGRPVCTLVAVAHTSDEALEELSERAARLRSELAKGTVSHAAA